MAETNRIGRVAAVDPVDEWIRSSLNRGSFIDIGGIGEYGANERCSWAKRCGYNKVAMADLEDDSHKLWENYRAQLVKNEVSGIDCMYNVNVDDANLQNKIGKWDFVHSTGILYHVPNPMHTLANYRRITASDLIINTVTIPTEIETELGSVAFNKASVLFLPSLEGRERDILRLYYKNKFGWDLNVVGPSVVQQDATMMPHILPDGSFSYYPYWWLFTVNAFEAAARLLDMEIVDTWNWENHAHFIWLRMKR